MDDPLDFGRNDPCWCGSPRKYKVCHGKHVPNQPGAPVPPDTDDGLYLSPTTMVAKNAFSVGPGGAPIVMPIPDGPYVPPPAGISQLAAALASVNIATPVDDLAVVGAARYALLTDLGLDDASIVDAQLAALPDDAVEELGRETLVHLRSTLDALERAANSEEPAATIWVPDTTPERAIGRSLLWAEHYLVPDPLAEQVLNNALERPKLAAAIRELLRLRPLVERGLVVPVAEDVARAATISAVDAELERDVRDPELLPWVDSQLEMEGPTAREALFFGARDDVRRLPHMELFARVNSADASTGAFSTRMLNAYDPSFDYEPWIKQTRTKVASRLIREVDEQLAVADALGAHLVTRAPFRARLLRKKQRLTASVPSVTALVEVPALESADAATLARIAANEEAVDAMRRALRRALRDVEEADVAYGVRNVQRLVEDLTEEAVHDLRKSMRRSATWAAAAPGGITLSSLAFGASPLIATAISAASAVAPYVAARAEHRARPAWIFHTGVRSVRSARRK